MAAIKTVILLGQYSIPISMRKATVETDIQLHEYHAKDRGRTCRKTLCAGCGKELSAGDIVKGFEYDAHCLVLLEKDELRQLRSDAENAIDILYSTSPELIPPYYYSQSYFAQPEPGGEKVFELIRSSLSEEQRILVGKAVTGGFDSCVAVGAAEDGLIVTRLYLDNEICRADKTHPRPPVSRGEREDVRELLNAIHSPFDLSAFSNDYQSNLRRLITSKTAEQKDTYSI